jgi:hypothetical protein
MNVSVQPQPAGALSIPGGPAQFSPNGTLIQVHMSDAAGNPVTTFQTPITRTVKYNSADLGQAGGNAASLTLGYVVDAGTPAIMNPDNLPIGTFLIAPPSNVKLDLANGDITFTTQGVTTTFVVLTNPVGFVQTLVDGAPELSSFADDAQVFGARAQFSYLRVVEPQIGGRLLVQDLVTGN